MFLESIALVGLPGSGKSRIQQALVASQTSLTAGQAVLAQDLKIVEVGEKNEQDDQSFDLVLCVIDVRSTLVADRDDWLEAQLQDMLSSSHAVIFNFLEASSLDDQSWWGSWIKVNASELTVFRVLNGKLSDSLFSLLSDCLPSRGTRTGGDPSKVLPQLAWDSFEFEVGPISLEHLLFGLDSSKQNLGMKIARVTGVVETIEYANLVELQGSALRWDSYAAAQDAVAGKISIVGQGLDRSWLQEIIKASLV